MGHLCILRMWKKGIFSFIKEGLPSFIYFTNLDKNSFVMRVLNSSKGSEQMNLTLVFNMVISTLLVLSNSNASSPIIGDWSPLEEGVGCGEQITFTKEHTFQLMDQGTKLIEGTYKEMGENRYLLNFFNGDNAEAEITYSNKRLILKLRNNEEELCQSYKIP
jgi:hypothetical protein